MSDEESSGDDLKLTPWDRRVIAAINVADGARKGVLLLRVTAALVAIFAIVGGALAYFSDVESTDGMGFGGNLDQQTVGYFLASIASPLAFAGLVLALSYLMQISASRLDIDIVLSDADETERDANG